MPAFTQNQVLKTTVNKSFIIDHLRKEAFKDIKFSKDLSSYPDKDPNFEENQQYIQRGIRLINGRFITYYSDKSYSIKILNDYLFNKSFCYNQIGQLEYINFDFYSKRVNSLKTYYESLYNSTLYPIKQYKYSYPNGNLIHVLIEDKTKIQYSFKPDGELHTYWIDNKCYDPDGNLIGERSTKPIIK